MTDEKNKNILELERRRHMAKHTLADLKDRAERIGRRHRSKQNQRYHLARELGFSASEAVILQNWPEVDIRQLAKEHDARTTS